MTESATSPSSTDIVAEVIDNGAIGKQQLVVIGLCLFLNMLDGFDITAMAVVAGTVSRDLVLAPEQLGWIFSFALLGMMMGAMFLAPAADVVGRRSMIIFSVALVGISILLTANATTLMEFIVLRFVSGLGAGAMLASQAALAAEYSPEKYRALAVTAVTSGYPLGAMMTSVVAGYVMPEYGWRGMFWFGGGLTLAMVVVTGFLIPESLKYLIERQPDGALQRVNRILAKLDKPGLTGLPDIRQTGRKPPARDMLGNMKKLLGKELYARTIMLWATFFLCFASLYFLMSWIPKLIEDSGQPAEVGRDAFLLFNLGGVFGIYLLGWLSTRSHLTKVISLFLVAGAIAMVIFASVPDRINLLMVIICVTGVLQHGGFTGLYATAAKIYPTEVRSTGIGWAIGLGRSGAVVGPALAGYLIAAGFGMSANFSFFAVPLILGGLLAYFLDVR